MIINPPDCTSTNYCTEMCEKDAVTKGKLETGKIGSNDLACNDLASADSAPQDAPRSLSQATGDSGSSARCAVKTEGRQLLRLLQRIKGSSLGMLRIRSGVHQKRSQ